jgi:hypothetical protein
MSSTEQNQGGSESSAHHLRKTLTWKGGFALALVIPNGLFVTFGYLIGVVGAWTAITDAPANEAAMVCEVNPLRVRPQG